MTLTSYTGMYIHWTEKNKSFVKNSIEKRKQRA